MQRVPKRAKLKAEFEAGDRVKVDFDGVWFGGTIKSLDEDTALVLFDDEDSLEIPVEEIEYETPDEKPAQKLHDGQGGGRGFNTWPVTWNHHKTSFNVNADGHDFFGCWRKTYYQSKQTKEKVYGYAVDIWCRYESPQDGKKHEYSVRTIFYRDESKDGEEVSSDPREKMRSLNGDICAAANYFLYRQLRGDMGTLDELRAKAERPIVHINDLDTLDELIVRLREFRAIAMRAGGQRTMAIPSDNSEDPHVGINIDVTRAAKLTKGSVPPIPDKIDPKKAKTEKPARELDKKGRPKKPVSSDQIYDLCEQLESSTDKKEQRAIRARLRRLGHTGGMRALRKLLEGK